MREINRIIIHCSATPPSMDIGAAEIRRWHTEGNGWSDIGYHAVVRRNGEIEWGRPEVTPGAHTKGHNFDSLGICWIGGVSEGHIPEDNRTPEQITALTKVITGWLIAHGYDTTIHGHNEFSSKACPCFDVDEYIERENLYDLNSVCTEPAK